MRWVMLKTEYSSLLNLITMPGRSCVAEIIGETSVYQGDDVMGAAVQAWPLAFEGTRHMPEGSTVVVSVVLLST